MNLFMELLFILNELVDTAGFSKRWNDDYSSDCLMTNSHLQICAG